MKRPKAPKPTAQELAAVERQTRLLDDEMEENERRLKAVARGKLGSKSLLAKAGGASKQSGVTRGLSGIGMSGGGSTGTSGLRSGSGYTATPNSTRKAR